MSFCFRGKTLVTIQMKHPENIFWNLKCSFIAWSFLWPVLKVKSYIVQSNYKRLYYLHGPASDYIMASKLWLCNWTITTSDISSPWGPCVVSSWEVEGADQLQWSSYTKVRGCFCLRQLIWFEPMSFSVGAQPAFSEWWVIGCQSSYRNYTWCLSSLSLFFFRLTECATSKSYQILSAHWLTFQQKTSSGIADGLCLTKTVCMCE